MHICSDITAMAQVIRDWRQQRQSIGFVPTMGNLHAGHVSLMQMARQQCDKVIVSIYVNPMQFNDKDDFAHYPRTMQDDQARLRQARVDALFIPTDAMMYPHGEAHNSYVDVPGLTDEFEGAHRPGHFRGVTTIVNKLFNITQPDKAFFGEKDYQQLLVIQKMVQDLNMGIEIIPVATMREADGLAMSSRNQRLSPQQREQATSIYKVLTETREKLQAGTATIEQLEQQAVAALTGENMTPDYVAIREAIALRSVINPVDDMVILAAVQLANIRLIDNIRL